MRGEDSVLEGRLVGLPKFHSWGKCTMPLTNIHSDWMFNTSSGLYIILLHYIIYADPLIKLHLGVYNLMQVFYLK